ncbi:MAG: hypothetical protein K2O05_03245 [Anaeroplasmataceae bacterium]|nr:hypothetical protein [Anaeroplasmataceae bacterium]
MKKIGIILVFILLLTSCGSAKEATQLAEIGEKIEVNSTNLNDESFINYLDKLDLFSASISSNLCAEKEVNTCISPLSIFMALSITSVASEGTSQDRLLNFLGVNANDIKTHTPLLYSTVNQSTNTSIVQVTNSIWLNETLKYNQDVVEELAKNQYCYPYQVDFKNKNKDANKAIQNFIKEQTNGLIDKNFELEEDTFLALINTLYFKDGWSDKLQKKKYSFKNANGTEKTTEFLQGKYILGVQASEENYSHFYTRTNRGYSLYFIVPKNNVSLKNVFTKETIYHVSNYQYDKPKNTYTRCIFPSFTAKYDEDIYPKLGLECVSLDRLVKEDEPNAIKKVDHVTKLEVNDEGIEGAAVTVVADAPTSAGPEIEEKFYYDFLVDRSFGYLILDTHGIPLFTGVVTNC